MNFAVGNPSAIEGQTANILTLRMGLWARCSTSLPEFGKYLMSLLAETKRRVIPATKFKFFTLLYKTIRYHVAVRLSSSVCHISGTLGHASCATFFLFLPQFGVICDLLLNRRTATWIYLLSSAPRVSYVKIMKPTIDHALIHFWKVFGLGKEFTSLKSRGVRIGQQSMS